MLGSLRHFDIIPWDDDVDVMMLDKDFNQLAELCESDEEKRRAQLPPGYDIYLYVHPSSQVALIKFFPYNAPETHRYPWRFPFLDIFELKEHRDGSFHRRAIDKSTSNTFTTREQLFPPLPYFLGGLWLMG